MFCFDVIHQGIHQLVIRYKRYSNIDASFVCGLDILDYTMMINNVFVWPLLYTYLVCWHINSIDSHRIHWFSWSPSTIAEMDPDYCYYIIHVFVHTAHSYSFNLYYIHIDAYIPPYITHPIQSCLPSSDSIRPGGWRGLRAAAARARPAAGLPQRAVGHWARPRESEFHGRVTYMTRVTWVIHLLEWVMAPC